MHHALKTDIKCFSIKCYFRPNLENALKIDFSETYHRLKVLLKKVHSPGNFILVSLKHLLPRW